jgi:hypothetical protein
VFLCDRIMHLTSYRGLGGTASSQSQDIFEMENQIYFQHYHLLPSNTNTRFSIQTTPIFLPITSSSSLCHQTNSSFWALTTRDNG